LFDKDDSEHGRAKQFQLINQSPFLTTDYIIDETLTLVRMRLGHKKAVEIGKHFWAQELAHLITVSPEDRTAGWKIFQRFDDKMFSFTDCVTFAAMARLGVTSAFTFDEHFRQYGKIKCLP
jgi:hypothetical protein